MWAQRAAAVPVPPAPPVRCVVLPNVVHIRIDEQNVGVFPDNTTRNTGILLLVTATFVLIIATLT